MDEKIETQIEAVVNNLNATTVARGVTKMLVRRSASAVIVTLIHTHIPEEVLNRNRKIQLSIAAWALGGAASDRAAVWAADRVENYVSIVRMIAKGVYGSSETEEEKPEPVIPTQE